MHDDRIDKTKDRTDKISLRCKNHPNLRWFTKNIDFVGARSIFFATARPIKAEDALSVIFANRLVGGTRIVTVTDLIHDLDLVHKPENGGGQMFAIECPCPISDLEVVA